LDSCGRTGVRHADIVGYSDQFRRCPRSGVLETNRRAGLPGWNDSDVALCHSEEGHGGTWILCLRDVPYALAGQRNHDQGRAGKLSGRSGSVIHRPTTRGQGPGNGAKDSTAGRAIARPDPLGKPRPARELVQRTPGRTPRVLRSNSTRNISASPI